MGEDERAIRGLIDTWLSASQAGDVPKVLSLMSDDVVFTVPGQKHFGKQEFAAASRRRPATSSRSRSRRLGLPAQ